MLVSIALTTAKGLQ